MERDTQFVHTAAEGVRNSRTGDGSSEKNPALVRDSQFLFTSAVEGVIILASPAGH